MISLLLLFLPVFSLVQGGRGIGWVGLVFVDPMSWIVDMLSGEQQLHWSPSFQLPPHSLLFVACLCRRFAAGGARRSL